MVFFPIVDPVRPSLIEFDEKGAIMHQKISSDPYRLLAAAVLQRAVWDARGFVQNSGCIHEGNSVQGDAQRFIADDAAVNFWIELYGADGERILPILRHAAKERKNSGL